MTIYFPFTESTTTVFQFQPTLDGQQYTATVTWNAAGRRYYLNLFTQQGALVLSIARVGSPLNYDIDLVQGYFVTSTLLFREPTQTFEVGP